MKRYPYRFVRDSKQKIFIITFSVLLVLSIIFLPGSNGVISVVQRVRLKRYLQREIEYYKIKSELIESKIAKGQNPEYLKRYLQDYYALVPKDSIK
ncbi:MAG: hypothetical protein ABIK33_06305 [candidate division WOR-3 bacterium]